LAVVKLQRAVAVWELELRPSRGGLIARETGRLNAFAAPKERRERELETMQYRILTFSINACDGRVFGADRRELAALVSLAQRHAPHPVRVDPLLKRCIIKMTRRVQHEIEPRHLRHRRIESHSMHPPHRSAVADEWDNWVAL